MGNFRFVWWFGFYDISTIVGYLMPNPVLFQTIEFSISTIFCLHAVKPKNSSNSNHSV